MKILVTGGTGFVGSHLVERLLALHHDVVCLVRDEAKVQRVFTGPKPQTVSGDLDATTALATAATGVDAVFHLAGLTAARNRAEFHRVNIQGTQTLASIVGTQARQLKRFVYVSSLAACGPTPPGTLTDASSKPQPVSQYGWSKLAGEEAVRRSSFPWVITRPPTVYGPRDTELFKLFKLAKTGVVPVFGSGNQRNSFVYVDDLTEALVHCLDSPAQKTYFPCHPSVYTQRELVHLVTSALGRKKPSRILGIPGGVARSALWVTGSVATLFGRATLLNADRANDFLAEAWTCSPSDLQQDTDWKATTDLAQGLTQTAQWYQRTGWL